MEPHGRVQGVEPHVAKGVVLNGALLRLEEERREKGEGRG